MPPFGANYPYDPCQQPGEIDDFDPVVFHAEHGEYDLAAYHLQPGEAYRKSLLGLDDVGVARLQAELAARGMAMVDEDTQWVFVAAGQSDAEGPDEARRRAGQRACTYRDFAGQLCPCATFSPVPGTSHCTCGHRAGDHDGDGEDSK